MSRDEDRAREDRAERMRAKVELEQAKAREGRHVPTAQSRREAAEWLSDRCARFSGEQGKSTQDAQRLAAESMRKEDRKRTDKE